ncbi:hypothetical protein NMG60_11032821 [Bertholletia excelsa]
MDLALEEKDRELLQSQALVLKHIFNFAYSMSLKCAIQLGIPDIIHKHGRPMTLSELATALSINKAKVDGLRRLMRFLIHSGFFAVQNLSGKDGEEILCYSLTPGSQILLKDEPISMAPYLLGLLDPILIKPWDCMSEWFQDDHITPFEMAHGMTLWMYGGHDPRFNLIFNQAMASASLTVSRIVTKYCRGAFEGLESLVDVGGGTGTLAKAISEAFPSIKCVVLDLPHVVANLPESDNLSYVGGDMFKSIPAADAVLLKVVLHDWSDEDSIKILKKCKEAVSGNGRHGKVVIIDMVMEQKGAKDELVETQLFLDLQMMVVTSGKERNEKEWATLFFSAGFSDYKMTHVLGSRSLIEVYP